MLSSIRHTCNKNSNIAEIQILLLTVFTVDLSDELLVDEEGREHQYFYIKFEGNAQCLHVGLIIVALMRVPTEIFCVVFDRFPEIASLLKVATFNTV